jgi:hypothetical protein
MAQNYIKEFTQITKKYFHNKTAMDEVNLTKNLTVSELKQSKGFMFMVYACML